MEILGVLFFGNLLLSLIAGFVAKGKGRSSFGYFCLSIFFSFFLTILVLIALPSLKESNAEQYGECPFCKEQVLRQAVVCKHCGRDITPLSSQVSKPSDAPLADYKGNKWLTLGSIFTILGGVLIWNLLSGLSKNPPLYGVIGTGVIDLAIFILGVYWIVKGNLDRRTKKPAEEQTTAQGSE